MIVSLCEKNEGGNGVNKLIRSRLMHMTATVDVNGGAGDESG
jgi:hypothetical protein